MGSNTHRTISRRARLTLLFLAWTTFCFLPFLTNTPFLCSRFSLLQLP